MNEPQNPGENPGNGELRDGPNGGKLKTGGTNPGAGRPPDDFKRRMRELVSRDDVEAFFEECLTGQHGAKYALIARAQAADRGYGKPVQAVEIGGTDGGPLDVTVRFVDVPKAE